MTLAISISPDAERRLANQASAAGIDLSTLASRILESALQERDTNSMQTSPKHNATIALLEQWAEDEKDMNDPEKAEQEFRELVEGLNAARRESEGPDARTPFPDDHDHS